MDKTNPLLKLIEALTRANAKPQGTSRHSPDTKTKRQRTACTIRRNRRKQAHKQRMALAAKHKRSHARHSRRGRH